MNQQNSNIDNFKLSLKKHGEAVEKNIIEAKKANNKKTRQKLALS
jgi:hypothetical protein